MQDPIKGTELSGRSAFQRIRRSERHGDSEIQSQFRGSVIFVTGGTGFVGKQLLEKLLRSCRGIHRVYVLMRHKKGKTISERLAKQWKDPVYDELRKIDPNFGSRVLPIQGDMAERRLGIRDEDWSKLIDEVNFIFHTAATVRFDESLKTAVLINVRGTKELLTLANDMLKLKSFVYMSTAYANCNRSEVQEVFYDIPVKPETIIDMAETIDDRKLEAMSKTLIEGWPNTYTFSKALAENLIKRTDQNIPACVIRPCVITPSFQEPSTGWLDISNVFGPSGIILGIGLGVIHTLYFKGDVKIDLVPVDYVNNLAITAAWDTIKRHESNQRDVMIYTCSRNRNPIHTVDIQHFLERSARPMATPKAIWYCFSVGTSSRLLYHTCMIFLHFIPALVVDALLTSAGDKPRLTNVYCKAKKINQVLSHFLFNNWIFSDENTLQLKNKMSKADKEIYQFDVTDINFNDYMTRWCLGIRKYIVKDGLKDTNAGVQKQRWLKFANFLVIGLYGLALWYILRGLFDIFYLFGVILLELDK